MINALRRCIKLGKIGSPPAVEQMSTLFEMPRCILYFLMQTLRADWYSRYFWTQDTLSSTFVHINSELNAASSLFYFSLPCYGTSRILALIDFYVSLTCRRRSSKAQFATFMAVKSHCCIFELLYMKNSHPRSCKWHNRAIDRKQEVDLLRSAKLRVENNAKLSLTWKDAETFTFFNICVAFVGMAKVLFK